tara:strand:- start:325 stop:855 length:531 start_codon:yes stop_codon:yes gene_type:complete
MGLNGAWLILFIPVLSFVVNILFQIIWCRFKAGGGLLKSEYLGCLWGLITLFLMHIYPYENQKSSSMDILFITTNFLIYLALSYCYFHFINLCLTARRIRLVRDLFASGNGLTLNEIQKNYNASEMLKKRTRRLLNSGQILEINGRYFIGKPMMLFAAWSLVRLKFIFLGKGSEYD